MLLMHKTILVTGTFNILHPGHLRLLRFAKSLGDYLVVAVRSDRLAGRGAYVPIELRLEIVQSNSYVNETILLDRPVEELITDLRPAIVVKGKEHETQFNIELEVVQKYGGQLIFGSGDLSFSSVDLLNNAFRPVETSSIQRPHDFMLRHNISGERLNGLLQRFGKLKIGVVGDLIVDEYITCQPIGMSQEDPTIVVTPIDNTLFLGGAAIVAAHAAGLGASVKLFSVTGNDASAKFAHTALANAGVESFLFTDDNRPTTLKQRFRCNGKSLLRVNFLHQRSISIDFQNQLTGALEQQLHQIDLLVFSDFNYGCIPQQIIAPIIKQAKSFGVFMAADSQSSSQIGDISRFKGMDLITPTEREARLSTRNHEDGLVVLASQLIRLAEAQHILLKLGEEGVLIDSQQAESGLVDRIGALNLAPQDVAGAGDSLLIAAAMGLVSGGSIWESALVGSIAAAVQVGRIGNTPLRIHELISGVQQIA